MKACRDTPPNLKLSPYLVGTSTWSTHVGGRLPEVQHCAHFSWRSATGRHWLCSSTERMAVAAEVAGSRDEAHFWRALPLTLATLRVSLPESFTQPPASVVLYTDPQTGISAYRRSSFEDRSRFAL